MKKIKMGLLALVSLVFSSISFSQAPTASGNVMNFSSVATYEPYADDESTWAGLRTIAEQSSTLTTIAEQESGSNNEPDTLYPDFLKEFMNTDYIFQIGNYLIKIDLVNDRGLVIASSNDNAYSSLVNNNLSATGMMVLGDEDLGLELLEALANNTTTPADYQSFLNAEGPTCSAAHRREDYSPEAWDYDHNAPSCASTPLCEDNYLTYQMSNKVVYQRAIFYFSLQSKIKSQKRCQCQLFPSHNPLVDLILTGTVKYKVKRACQTEINKSENKTCGFYGGCDGNLDWRPYSSGRALSHYDFFVQFGIRHASDRNPNPPPYTMSRQYHIQYGYY